MILITTPTGDIGARVLRRVMEGGDPIRVIARNPARMPVEVRARIEVVEGSQEDRSVIDRALDGVDRVFWLPPGGPEYPSAEAAYVGFSRAFCDALPGSDIAHVVGVSALGRGWPKPAGHVTASLAMDDGIGATGVAYRALACASLMDNLLRQAEPIRGGAFYAPTPGDLRLPHVAKADVAAIAARFLLEPHWSGVAEVPLCGPEDLSFDEIATILSASLDRSVQFHAIPMDAFEGMMREAGARPGMARAYVEMLTAKNEGMDAAACPASRADTPTTFRQWCEAELRPAIAETPTDTRST